MPVRAPAANREAKRRTDMTVRKDGNGRAQLDADETPGAKCVEGYAGTRVRPDASTTETTTRW